MTGKVKQHMVFIVAAVLVVDFALFGYGPSMQRLEKLKHSQESYHNLMNNSLMQQGKMIVLKRQTKKQQEALSQWQQRIPRRREIGPFVQTVSQLMSRHGLVDQGIEPGREDQVDRLGTLPLTLRCRGDLDQIYGFYRDLQKQTRLIRIQKLHLSQVAPPGKGIEMETDVMLFYGGPDAFSIPSKDGVNAQKS